MIRVLEQNGVINTNKDGTEFNKFCSSGLDFVVSGIDNTCRLYLASSSRIGIGTGLLVIQGVRIRIDEDEILTLSSAPSSYIPYNIVVTLTYDLGDFNVKFEVLPQTASLVQDALHLVDSGKYQVILGTFVHSPDGSISSLTKVLPGYTSVADYIQDKGLFYYSGKISEIVGVDSIINASNFYPVYPSKMIGAKFISNNGCIGEITQQSNSSNYVARTLSNTRDGDLSLNVPCIFSPYIQEGELSLHSLGRHYYIQFDIAVLCPDANTEYIIGNLPSNISCPANFWGVLTTLSGYSYSVRVSGRNIILYTGGRGIDSEVLQGSLSFIGE